MPNASRFKVNIPPSEMKKGVWSTTHQMKLRFYLYFGIESLRWWSLLVFYGSKGKRVELAHNTFMNYRYMHLYCLLFYSDKHLWSRTGITKWCTSYEEINDIQLDPFFYSFCQRCCKKSISAPRIIISTMARMLWIAKSISRYQNVHSRHPTVSCSLSISTI